MKKILFPLFTVYFLLFTGAVYAYTSTDVQNATFLADQNIIVKQSVDSKYRLDDTITRAEVVGMALKIKGITLPESYSCKNYFSDVKYDAKNNWVCRAVELAADGEIVSRTNTKFRPQDTITRAEALAIIMKAGGVEIQNGIGVSEGFSYFDKNGNIAEHWQLDVMESARQINFITPVVKTSSAIFSGMQGTWYEYYWRHNENATRAEVFGFAKNVIVTPGLPRLLYLESDPLVIMSYDLCTEKGSICPTYDLEGTDYASKYFSFVQSISEKNFQKSFELGKDLGPYIGGFNGEKYRVYNNSLITLTFGPQAWGDIFFTVYTAKEDGLVISQVFNINPSQNKAWEDSVVQEFNLSNFYLVSELEAKNPNKFEEINKFTIAYWYDQLEKLEIE